MPRPGQVTRLRETGIKAELSSKGDKNVVFKGLIAATASLALMAAPAVAAGSTTAAAAQAAQVNPASEDVEGLEASGNIVIIVLALIAVGLGIWALLDDGDD